MPEREAEAAVAPDPVPPPKVEPLPEPLVRPAATKKRLREVCLYPVRGLAKVVYEFLSATDKPVMPWEVEIVNGDCLANGGDFDGKKIFIKDGFVQVAAIFTAARGDVFAALDAKIAELGLMP